MWMPAGSTNMEYLRASAQILNNITGIDYRDDLVRIGGICDVCGELGCSPSSWLSLRWAGDYGLLIPAFSKMVGMLEWDEYGPPWEVDDKGGMLLDRAECTRLFDASLIKPLSGREAVLLLLFEAPAGILRKTWNRVEYKRELLLATDHESDEEAIEALDRLLETGSSSDAPVELRSLSDADRPVSFFFDRPRGFAEWQPLAFVGERARLLLEPGYVVEWEGEDEQNQAERG